ncbi:hypothetical protein VCR14J2_50030 [Vibrio coralliirubri]|nr:hypothetical protein VCR14J2_50030 [Vibrio coralliirubri]
MVVSRYVLKNSTTYGFRSRITFESFKSSRKLWGFGLFGSV